MGVQTDSLSPSHTFVPWIVINDQYDNKQQMEAMKDLLGLVCRLYQGPKPQECNQSEELDILWAI